MNQLYRAHLGSLESLIMFLINEKGFLRLRYFHGLFMDSLSLNLMTVCGLVEQEQWLEKRRS